MRDRRGRIDGERRAETLLGLAEPIGPLVDRPQRFEDPPVPGRALQSAGEMRLGPAEISLAEQPEADLGRGLRRRRGGRLASGAERRRLSSGRRRRRRGPAAAGEKAGKDQRQRRATARIVSIG